MGWLDEVEPSGDTIEAQARLVALVRAVQADPNQFPLLFDYLWERIRRFCYLRGNSWIDSDDIAQQVMIAIARRLQFCSFEHGASDFNAWWATIARNACTDAYRARRSRPYVPLPETGAASPVVPGADEEILASSEHDWLRGLLSHLTPDQQAVMELRLAELTTKEIALALGKSQSAVAKHTERARLVLRSLIAAADGGEHV